jgi:hypothetical protein
LNTASQILSTRFSGLSLLVDHLGLAGWLEQVGGGPVRLDQALRELFDLPPEQD